VSFRADGFFQTVDLPLDARYRLLGRLA